MTKNVGTIDRVLRAVLGVFLLVIPFIGGIALFESGVATAISVIAGIVMLATSTMRFCPMYRIFGIRTCKM
jgi:hypothetical protein